MSRKNLINIILFFVLIVASILIVRENKSNKTELEPDAFAVKDTAAVSKVFIADMKGQSVTLTRDNEKVWLINDQHIASNTKIEMMLEVLAKMEIKMPVPESAKNNVLRDLAVGGIKVELYKKGKKRPFKVFYVGGPTNDMLGTYMMLDKKNRTPYIMHIPGWYGYLSDGYFFTETDDWRSTAVFQLNPASINSIQLDYPSSPDSSFLLNVKGISEFSLINIASKNAIDFNPLRVKAFIQAFGDINFLTVDKTIDKKAKDSVLKSVPFAIIKVITNDKKTLSLTLFFKPSNLQTKVELLPGIDKEYFYAVFSERKNDLLIMQTLQLSTILWAANNFL